MPPAPAAEEESDEGEEDTETKGAPKATPLKYFDLVNIRRGIMNLGDHAKRQTALKRKLTIRKDIIRLMNLVVICGDFAFRVELLELLMPL